MSSSSQTDNNSLPGAERDAYQMLLFEYACGSLDEAQSLLMAAHLTLSAEARKVVSFYEALGGALMTQACKPVPMKETSLTAVLERLDCEETKQNCISTQEIVPGPGDMTLPQPLARFVKRARREHAVTPKWRTILPGIAVMKLSPRDSQQHIRLFRVKPGVKAPNHSHDEPELTLVLEGRLHDQNTVFQAGDLVFSGGDTSHSPRACEQDGCICVTVGGRASGFYGFLERLFNL